MVTKIIIQLFIIALVVGAIAYFVGYKFFSKVGEKIKNRVEKIKNEE
jgi:hypothetical protein